MAYISQPKSKTMRAQMSSVGSINPQFSHATVTADEASKVAAANKVKAANGMHTSEPAKKPEEKKGKKWMSKAFDSVLRATSGV